MPIENVPSCTKLVAAVTAYVAEGLEPTALKGQADPAWTSAPRRPAARAALHTVQSEPSKRGSTIRSYAACAFAIREGIRFSSVVQLHYLASIDR